MTIQQSSKISQTHLLRKAIVYLRQSSQRQVQYNKESTRLQYAVADKIRELGWKEVEIIDSDLGTSAGVGSERVGFDKLIAMVAKGEVGIVASREVSRLSRTDKDWCRLLEICQIFDTLVSDSEQIYNLSLLGDQLVLGIKGTLSVVELKTIQMRMLAGKEEKALRGELFGMLPVGYELDLTGKVAKDPNLRIQEAINLIFRKFREIWSVRGTYFWFLEEGITLPVHSCYGVGRKIIWKLPTYSFIANVLKNAFYAGAYIWGWQETVTIVEEGEIKKRRKRNYDPEKCKIFIPDHHEKYIDWNIYKENLKIIAGNKVSSKNNDSPGSVRSGRGLLSGLLRCGSCGRKVSIDYWNKSSYGYTCVGSNNDRSRHCFGFGGKKVDQRFEEEILKVLSPLGTEASLTAVDQLQSGNDEKRNALEKQLQQVEYEASRAFEQFDAVDPKNRLVATELEKRWNNKLQEVEKLKTYLENLNQPIILEQEERERILQLGRNFQKVWQSEHITFETKKKIIRTVVENVIANLEESGQKLHFIIHWKGGSHTEFFMERPASAAVIFKTSAESLEIIRQMGVKYGDDEIACVLNKLGHSTGRGNAWTAKNVQSMRFRYSISGQSKKIKPNILTLNQAAKYCNVSNTTIKKLALGGIITNQQSISCAPWEIDRADLDSKPVQKILRRLHKTGKLIIKKDNLDNESLF